MDTGMWRGLRAALAGSLLFGATVVASVFVGSLPASASPPYTSSTIGVGQSPAGVAVDPKSGNVFVTNESNPGTVSVISEASDTVTHTITVGTYPEGVAVDPSTGTVYVASSNGGANIGTVSVISEATNTVTKTIAMGSNVDAVAVNPSTHTVYVTTNDGYTNTPGAVSVISEATNTVTSTIPVGDFPVAVAVNPNTGTVYVANLTSGTVSEINGLGIVTVGGQPGGVAVDPNTGSVYVTNDSKPGTVWVISEATNTVTHTIAVGKYPGGVAVDPNTGTVYVTNEGSATVSVINEATNAVINTISVGAVGTAPVGVAADPSTASAYVANSGTNNVSVIRQTPAVSAVSPNAGPTKGGTAITITGTGFVSGATVKIGQGVYPAIAATNVVVASPTKITAVTGGAMAGTWNVSVTTPGGTSAANPNDSFSYDALPTVATVSPNSGPTTGGTAITITGTGFVSGATVKIGQGVYPAIAATNVVVASPTKITAVTGGGAKAGTWNLFATTPGGSSAAHAGDDFTY